MLLLRFTPPRPLFLDSNSLNQPYGKRSFFLFFSVVYIGEFILNTNSTTFLMLIELYIIGRYFKSRPQNFIERNSGIILIIGLSTLSLSFGCTFYFLNAAASEKVLTILQNNHNPLLIITAISMFYWFKRRKFSVRKGCLERISKYMFAVYIIHAYAKNSIIDYSEYIIEGHTWISLFLLALLTFILCMLLEKSRQIIFDKCISSLINKVVS